MQILIFATGKLFIPALGSRIYKSTAQTPLKYGGVYTVIYAIIDFVKVHFKISLLPDFSPQFVRKYMFVSVSGALPKIRLMTAG